MGFGEVMSIHCVESWSEGPALRYSCCGDEWMREIAVVFHFDYSAVKETSQYFFKGIGRLNLCCIFQIIPECHTVSKAFCTSFESIAVLNP